MPIQRSSKITMRSCPFFFNIKQTKGLGTCSMDPMMVHALDKKSPEEQCAAHTLELMAVLTEHLEALPHITFIYRSANA